jgi:hypothetical protein
VEGNGVLGHTTWSLSGIVSGSPYADASGSVQFCDAASSGFKHGVHITDQPYSTGFTACNNWSNYSGAAWRTDSTNGYTGVCWAENAHSACGAKTVSVGVR